MSRIEAIRGGAGLPARPVRPEAETLDGPVDAPPATGSGLPVPVGPVRRIEPRGFPQEGQSGFATQLIGQEGAKRGLRAGAELFDRARTVYNRTEWSGARDRRARKGTTATTRI